MKKYIIIAVLISLFGCKTEQEKIRDKQIEVCQEQIKSGQEPTQFCVNLLPEYRTVAQTQQPEQYTVQPYQQSYEQPVQQVQQAPVQAVPQYVPVPTQAAPVASGSSTADTIRDMAIGGMVGHALGSRNNQNYNPPTPQYDSYRSTPRYVSKNVTIINKAPITQAPPVVSVAPKKNYMDTSKLSSYGARPSAPARSSSMNMSRLSSSGRR